MREQRKVVTVLFADVVGSTRFASETDPEVVRAQMTRYFDRITEIADAHGGTVEKFAGDAAMVVFGMPAAHDDDAERAVRAAMQVRDSATEVAVRVGVNTGEAVTSLTEARQNMVTGDTVNVAARLQQGADAGEVVVGLLTERLTRSVIEYAPREPVVAKGKSEPLAAFRALRPRTQVPSQARGVPGLQSPMVGRERELRLLVDTFERVVADRRLHLFTIAGTAGVGKSRLVDEALVAIAGSGARVLRGRCLPYGHGITYWPLIEMVQQDTGITLADQREAAMVKLDRWLGELLPGDPERPAVRSRLGVMMGYEQPAAVMPDTPPERVHKEIAWAVRRYFEALAASTAVIAVVDDLQWAEPPLLDIFEQLAERMADVPLLLICATRPEFIERRRDWGAGNANSSTISLHALSADETGRLISHLLEVEALPPHLRSLIVERSAGTPLFCEELIRMLVDDGRLVREGTRWRATGELEQVPVPPSINAVLAARLDGLPEGDRAVLQAASVIGQRFTTAQVAAVFAGADLDSYVDSLRRKGLVAGDDRPGAEMQFSHLLVRDAAYGSLTKSERAALHDRFGAVLQAQSGETQPIAEILAHHAERAFSLSAELSLGGEVMQARAGRALEWSLAIADRAATRQDAPVLEGALKVVRAAGALLPDRGGLEAQAGVAMLDAQHAVMVADYPAAESLCQEAAGIAEAAGLDRLVARARLTQAWIANWSGMESLADFDAIATRAIEACRRAGDREGEIEARFVGANILWGPGRLLEFVDRLRVLLDEARRIGDRRHMALILGRLAPAEMLAGNRAEAIRCEEEAAALAAELGLRGISLRLLLDRALRVRMEDGLAASETGVRQYLAGAVEAGARQQEVSAHRFLGELLNGTGRFAEGAATLDRAIEISVASGERWNRAELYAQRAESSLGLGDLAAAKAFVGGALQALRDDDLSAEGVVYAALGQVLAAEERPGEAEEAYRKGLEAAYAAEFPVDRLNAQMHLARFLAYRGRADEARILADDIRRRKDSLGWHYWDGELDALEGLIAKNS